MKKTLLLILIALGSFTALADEPTDLSSLPAPVQATIKEWKGQGEVKKVKTVRSGGKAQYVVDLKERGDETQLVIAPDGSVLSEESTAKGKGKGKAKGKAKGHDKQKDGKSGDANESEKTAAAPSSTANAPAPQPKAEPAPTVTTTPAPAPAPAPAPTPNPAPVTAPKQAEVARTPQAAANAAAVNATTELMNRVRRINELDKNAAVAKVGLNSVATETGVRVTTLQAQVKEFNIGTGGLLVCNEIAKATGKPASTYIKQRLQNKEWSKIAADTKFDLSTVLPKLQRVQQAMETAHATQKR